MSKDRPHWPDPKRLSATPHLRFQEGSIAVPSGYEDRTTNLFVPPDPEQQANFSVARDWLGVEESLESYAERQCAALEKHLAGYRMVRRTPTELPSSKPTRSGIVIDTEYRQGRQMVYQRQVAFLIAPRRVMIFTAASPRPLDAEFETFWNAWLASVQLNAPEASLL